MRRSNEWVGVVTVVVEVELVGFRFLFPMRRSGFRHTRLRELCKTFGGVYFYRSLTETDEEKFFFAPNRVREFGRSHQKITPFQNKHKTHTESAHTSTLPLTIMSRITTEEDTELNAKVSYDKKQGVQKFITMEKQVCTHFSTATTTYVSSSLQFSPK